MKTSPSAKPTSSRPLNQIVRLDLFVTVEGDIGDSLALGYDDHEHVAIALQAYVFEKSGLIQRAHGIAGTLIVD